MSVADSFSRFISSLTPAELETLGGALRLAASAMVLGEGEGGLSEARASAKSLSQGQQLLGPGFDQLMAQGEAGYGRMQQQMFGQLREELKQADTAEKRAAYGARLRDVVGNCLPGLELARPIIEKMAPELRESFEDYFAHWMLNVADASGGFLYWGNVSEAEGRAAARIFAALAVTVRDPKVRQKFGLDAHSA